MKNNFFLSIVFLLLSLGNINAEELNITAKEIDIDDKNKIIIFSGDVIIEDNQKNYLKSENITYQKNKKLVFSPGKTTIVTSEGFKVFGSNITFDDLNQKFSQTLQLR